ncbi:nuclear pore complex protein Nup107-like isoform X2 [Anneissia japonica]|uniref:nuclear pore complex protein Nup107-like isoform X2 n=2 Tax=Anneissia japonica TaxID=1529436 RepID=UPI00142592E5|nr:nuclear pore complex protein Nup107-like isoform X2 [Anneissia japonica]
MNVVEERPNRLSSSFFEQGETSLTNIWKTQQKYISGNMNEKTDRHEDYNRSLSFGVAENSPIPRSISKNAKGSSFLRGQKNHSERIRRSMGLLDQAATPGLGVPATPSSALKYSTYTPNKLPIPSQYDVTGILSHTPRRLKTPSTPDPMGLGNMSVADQTRLAASLLVTPLRPPTTSLESMTPGAMTEDVTLTNVNLLLEDDPGMSATAGLFEDFMKSFRMFSSPTDVFRLVAEYEKLCSEQVTMLNKLVKKANPGQNKFSKTVEVLNLLDQEKCTWRLLGSLYQDRQQYMEDEENMDTGMDILRKSEQEISNSLFARNSSLRQSQIVVDWLERNAVDQIQDYYENVEFYSQSVCWENTLHSLQQKTAGVSRSDRNLVSQMDPDAPIRENKPLAELDREDEARLLKNLFAKIRAGQLEDAQRLCKKCGQAWRAATLEGWKLYHDSNMKASSGNIASIEGNPNRDIWKATAWRMSQDERFHPYERAIAAVFSGNLKEVLPVCRSWDDCLWAYFRVMVDQQVEQEIRENVEPGCECEPLPDNYFDKLLTTTKIFQDLQAFPSEEIEMQSKQKYHMIQKYLILGEVDALIEEMGEWLQDVANRPSKHLVRFMAHVVLFFRSLGLDSKEEICTAIIEAYVKDLVDVKHLELVSVYAAQLPEFLQVACYAHFLEGIHEKETRKYCLQLAEDAGLDVPKITKTVVENIRNRDLTEFDADTESTPALDAATSEEDRKKIEAIDWLVFDPSQRAEALKQSNAVMRTFLGIKKHDAAREVFHKIPGDTIDVILKNWLGHAGRVPLPTEDDNAIKEYLCIKAYLNALDTFNDWFEHYHNRKPVEPSIQEVATFQQKVHHEHKEKEFKMELERWEHGLNNNTKAVVDNIYNVLLFPDGGWMVDQHTEDSIDNARATQLERLREICIPMLCFLLQSVLHTTGQYQQAIMLADVIASEEQQLYTVFDKDELRKLLQKLRESSIELLDSNLDALGYEM